MAAATHEPTCAERLPEHLAGRLADLRAILARDDMDEGDDELPPLTRADAIGIVLHPERAGAPMG